MHNRYVCAEPLRSLGHVVGDIVILAAHPCILIGLIDFLTSDRQHVVRESVCLMLPMFKDQFAGGLVVVHGPISADVCGPAHMAEPVVTIAFLKCCHLEPTTLQYTLYGACKCVYIHKQPTPIMLQVPLGFRQRQDTIHEDTSRRCLREGGGSWGGMMCVVRCDLVAPYDDCSWGRGAVICPHTCPNRLP